MALWYNMYVLEHCTGSCQTFYLHVRVITEIRLHVFLDFLVTVKAAPHECVIRTG